MTDNNEIPCCDNCDCFEERDNVQLGEWITVPTCRGKIISESTPMVTRGHGCLSHPQAREYINRDVIKEIEEVQRKIETACSPSYKADIFDVEYRLNMLTLKLLKEGAKK